MRIPWSPVALGGVVALAAFGLGACGGAATRQASIYLERSGSAARPLQVTPVLAPVTRQFSKEAPLVPSVLGALIAGPTAAERERGFLSGSTLQWRVLSVRVSSGTARVNLAGPPVGLAGEAALVYTLTALPGINRVTLFAAGQPCCLRDLGGRVIEPLTRTLFRGTPFEPCETRTYSGAVACVDE